MVVMASGQGGVGGVSNAAAWCKAGFSGTAIIHIAAHANYKTV